MASILLVDSDEVSQRLISLVASQRGYETSAIDEPLACRIYAGATGPCPADCPYRGLMIIGSPLPRMSGLELLRRQGAGGCAGNLQDRAVLLSGSNGERAEAAALGIRAFRRPFVSRDITDWLREREFASGRDSLPAR
jgi:CheY-like chemotaxis protein